MTNVPTSAGVGSKAVNISNLSDYGSYGEVVSSFGQEISGSLGSIKVDFVNKTEDSAGEAIAAYLTQLENFEQAIYEQLPAEIETIGGHFKSYSESLVGLGFESSDRIQTDDSDISSYFSKVTKEGGEQQTAIDAKIKELQGLLDEVNAKAGGDFTTSSIQTTIDEALSAHQTSVQGLHDNVLSSQSTFISNLSSSSESLLGLCGVMDRISSISAKNSGLRPSDIKDVIVNQTASPSEIASALAAAATAKDASALGAYLKKDFVAFFEHDPNSLSQGTYEVVVTGMNAIMMGEDADKKTTLLKNFEKGVNSFTNKNGYLDEQGYKAFMVNLSAAEKLYGGAVFKQALALKEKLESEGQDLSKDTTYQTYLRMLNTAGNFNNLFEALYSTPLYYGKPVIKNLRQTEDLDNQGNSKGFQYTYQANNRLKATPYNGSINTYQWAVPSKENLYLEEKTMTTSFLSTNEFVGSQLAAYQSELAKERDALVAEWSAALAANVLTFGQGAVASAITTTLISVASNASFSNAASNSSDVASIYFEEKNNNLGKHYFSGVSATISAISGYADISRKMEDINKTGYINFFGQTGYRIDASGGTAIYGNPYDIDYYSRVQEMEKNGASKAIEAAGYEATGGEYIRANEGQTLKEKVKYDDYSNDRKKAFDYMMSGTKSGVSLTEINWEEFDRVRQDLDNAGIDIGREDYEANAN